MNNDNEIDKKPTIPTGQDSFTLRNPFEGILVYGIAGSGKSSNPNRASEKALTGGTKPTQSKGEANEPSQ